MVLVGHGGDIPAGARAWSADGAGLSGVPEFLGAQRIPDAAQDPARRSPGARSKRPRPAGAILPGRHRLVRDVHYLHPGVRLPLSAGSPGAVARDAWFCSLGLTDSMGIDGLRFWPQPFRFPTRIPSE